HAQPLVIVAQFAQQHVLLLRGRGLDDHTWDDTPVFPALVRQPDPVHRYAEQDHDVRCPVEIGPPLLPVPEHVAVEGHVLPALQHVLDGIDEPPAALHVAFGFTQGLASRIRVDAVVGRQPGAQLLTERVGRLIAADGPNRLCVPHGCHTPSAPASRSCPILPPPGLLALVIGGPPPGPARLRAPGPAPPPPEVPVAYPPAAPTLDCGRCARPGSRSSHRQAPGGRPGTGRRSGPSTCERPSPSRRRGPGRRSTTPWGRRGSTAPPASTRPARGGAAPGPA